MINKKKVVILIIAHKPQLTPSEIKSMKQCYSVLGKHPIKFICPEGLDISEYKKINPLVEIDFIDPKWQSTYAMFNRLKIEPLLYKKYKDLIFSMKEAGNTVIKIRDILNKSGFKTPQGKNCRGTSAQQQR
jgi:hypothetical protein